MVALHLLIRMLLDVLLLTALLNAHG